MPLQPPRLQCLLLVFGSVRDRADWPTRRMQPELFVLATLAMCGLFPLLGSASADERKQPPGYYLPQPDDFRAAYDADGENESRQSWDEYYGWVKAFYRGNLFASGWTRQAKRVAEAVDDRQVREEIIVRSNALGRQISQEWSKDNAVRRIDSDDLTTFGRQLKQAVKDDDGSGTAVGDALKDIEKVVGQRLGKPDLESSAK